jgi:endoglucanase
VKQFMSRSTKFSTLTIIVTRISVAALLVTGISVLSPRLSHQYRPQSASAAHSPTPVITVLSPQPLSYNDSKLVLSADLSGTSTADYDMFWYVDGGPWNWMGTAQDQTTKQASIDVGGWNWHAPSSQYTLTVVAVLHGNGARFYSGVPINVISAQISPKTTIPTHTAPSLTNAPMTSAPTSTSSGTVSASTITPSSSLSTSGLYVDPNSSAAQSAASATDTTTKRVMSKIATQPTAAWFGDWNTNIGSDVSNYVGMASAAQKTAILVAYNIPERDCSGYSGGGASSASVYQSWIHAMATAIGNRSALVVLEPDATAQINCLSSGDQAQRYQLLQQAITELKANPSTKVYLDAGNPNWVPITDMASRLTQAGITHADGFSLNVSNFVPTSVNQTYGNQLSGHINNKHYIIDTSRNGNGDSGQWCNPTGRAVGSSPTANTGVNLVDAFLWVKTPGASDGACNGGPNAGNWWPEYALGLGLSAGY